MLSVEQRKRYPIPIGISPSAMQKLVGDDGEIDIAKAAGSWGTNMILSSHTHARWKMSSKHLVETIWWITGSSSISRTIGKDVCRLSDNKGARYVL